MSKHASYWWIPAGSFALAGALAFVQGSSVNISHARQGPGECIKWEIPSITADVKKGILDVNIEWKGTSQGNFKNPSLNSATVEYLVPYTKNAASGVQSLGTHSMTITQGVLTETTTEGTAEDNGFDIKAINESLKEDTKLLAGLGIDFDAAPEKDRKLLILLSGNAKTKGSPPEPCGEVSSFNYKIGDLKPPKKK